MLYEMNVFPSDFVAKTIFTELTEIHNVRFRCKKKKKKTWKTCATHKNRYIFSLTTNLHCVR